MTISITTVCKRLLYALFVIILLLTFALVSLAISARFSDGPSVIFAGGILESGELVTGPEPDWSFARDINLIELQLVVPPRSRTLWVVEYQGSLYLNSNYMGGLRQRLWKKWPSEAERDGRAILRIDGKRYERHLVRIKSGGAVEGVTKEFTRKYGVTMTPQEVEDGKLWLFELAPPQSNTSGGEV